jgi:hypothetical protein
MELSGFAEAVLKDRIGMPDTPTRDPGHERKQQ